ncbi:hypothetical protein CsSME_00048589 [Camellia sinensis var. sinensis]
MKRHSDAVPEASNNFSVISGHVVHHRIFLDRFLSKRWDDDESDSKCAKEKVKSEKGIGDVYPPLSLCLSLSSDLLFVRGDLLRFRGVCDFQIYTLIPLGVAISDDSSVKTGLFYTIVI